MQLNKSYTTFKFLFLGIELVALAKIKLKMKTVMFYTYTALNSTKLLYYNNDNYC